MSPEENTMERDLENICEANFIPWDKLSGKTVLVTGATGLIGYTLVNGLLYANRRKGLDVTVVALVRDEKRARKRFGEEADELIFAVGSVEDLPEFDGPIDYIVHGASQTASKAFVCQPVETILTAVNGTENVLELARQKQVSGLTYLSSMEMYGFPEKGHKVTEKETGGFSPLEIRNSYPLSKLLCENLCCAYASEYGVPAKILRLTQTFGLGVNYNDGRVFAEFGRCVLEKRDIVLKTKGETERSYLYTVDAAAAILTVLLKGEVGEAYNAADESTYCSIAEMAQTVAEMGGIGVQYDLQDVQQHGYSRTLYMDLDTSRLQGLGWHSLLTMKEHPEDMSSLKRMYRKLLASMGGSMGRSDTV